MKKTWKVHNMKENGKKKEKKLAGRNMDDNEMDDNMDDKANMSDQGYDVNAIHIVTHNALKPDEEMVVTLVRIQSIQGLPRKQKSVTYCQQLEDEELSTVTNMEKRWFDFQSIQMVIVSPTQHGR